jgi:hypothetical protein
LTVFAIASAVALDDAFMMIPEANTPPFSFLQSGNGSPRAGNLQDCSKSEHRKDFNPDNRAEQVR